MFDKKYALFVNSGSSANLLGLAALQLDKGSECITPSMTFNTTCSPIIQLGLNPIFCDVELTTFVPDIDKHIKPLINKNTKIIMLPNLIGSRPDWKKLRELLIEINRTDIYLFEDNADSFCSTKYSDLAICSFYSSHIITCAGGSGCLFLNSKSLYEKAYSMMNWGRTQIGNSEKMEDRFNTVIELSLIHI